MSEHCQCCASAGAPIVPATDTVEAVVRRVPEALEVMKELGINHCCGAHLTLAEAAASAGVPLATLLERLAAAGAAP
jgi:iron-sulfur cluster repair protein YtfE (RIC family)